MKAFNICIILCVNFLLSAFVFCDRYSRLEKRINILEQKMHHDTTIFREDITDIFQTLDNFSLNIPDGKTVQNHEKEKPESKYDTKEIDKVVQVMKRTFSEEKKHMREMVIKAREELSEKGSQQEDVYETLRSDLTNMLINVSSKFETVQSQMDKINMKFGAVQSAYNDTEDEILLMKILQDSTIEKSVNNSEDLVELSKKYDLLSRRLDCHSNLGYSFKDSCYYIEKDVLLTWAQANEKCERDGAYLVEIDSEDENSYLIKLATKLTPADQLYGVWAGASDLENEGVWVWKKSKRLVYRTFNNFKGNEPNGYRRESCLHLIRKYSWNWNDYLCNSQLAYICEKPL